MRAVTLIACLFVQEAVAGVAFENRSDALPDHRYEGGWEHFVGGGLAVFDCNNDGLPDVFAAGGTSPATLIINGGQFAFAKGDLPELKGVTGAYPIDLDGDGLQDLFVLRVGRNVALKGLGQCAFTIANEKFGLPESDAWSTAFSAWWAPGDKRPTLAIGNYVDRHDPDGPFEACDDNEILVPENTGYRRQILRPGYCPLSILAAEDARGRLSLRLSNDRHYYVRAGHEQMWDITAQRFLTEDDGWRNVSLWGMGIASRDLTGDARDEVMLTSMGDQVLQIAQSDGTYKAAPYAIGTYAQRPHIGGDGRPSTGWHAEFGDVDNDGRADLFIAKGNVDQMPGLATRDPNNLLVQNEDGSFREVSVEAGVASMARSRGGALVDFDGDGRLDLIVSNRRAPLELFRNVTPDAGNWVRVDLVQNGGNRDAIGARITVRTGALSQTVQRVIGGGHAGGQLLPLHFGIGSADAAVITVRWPDGSETQVDALSNRYLRIEKP